MESYTKGLADVEDQIKVEVHLPLFAEKKVATLMQKFIVPWSIAIHCLSFAKAMKIEQIKEILIAVIDELQLIPGHPDTVAVAKRHSVTF